jgi:hypothetical protein
VREQDLWHVFDREDAVDYAGRDGVARHAPVLGGFRTLGSVSPSRSRIARRPLVPSVPEPERRNGVAVGACRRWRTSLAAGAEASQLVANWSRLDRARLTNEPSSRCAPDTTRSVLHGAKRSAGLTDEWRLVQRASDGQRRPRHESNVRPTV